MVQKTPFVMVKKLPYDVNSWNTHSTTKYIREQFFSLITRNRVIYFGDKVLQLTRRGRCTRSLKIGPRPQSKSKTW